MVEGLVSLVATSVRKKTEHEFDEEQEDQETHNFSICHIKDGAFLPIRCCREWLLVLCLLIKCQHSLQSVTITDPEKQGKLVLRDEQLVEWRKNLLCGGFFNNFMPQTFRMGWLRELHLPLSGYLMKGVYFVFTSYTSESDSSTEYDDVMTWEYEGEEKLLGEAVSEILTNRGQVVVTLRFNRFYNSYLPQL